MNKNRQKEFSRNTPALKTLITLAIITLGIFTVHASTFANSVAANANPINESLFDLRAESQRAALLAEAKQKSIAWKNAGNTVWGSENWMKEPEYYQDLTTEQLAEECFARSIFGFEMSIYNDPAYGFIRLEVHHNGFAELFKRDDMYKGILHIYHQYANVIDPQNDSRTIVSMSINLDGMTALYNYPPFTAQLKGHEMDFFDANVQILQKSLDYLNTPNPNTGGEPTLYFYGEVASVANVALSLVKRIDPVAYNTIEPKIHSYRWPSDQKNEYLRQYLRLALSQLESFKPPQNIPPDINHPARPAAAAKDS